MRYIAVLLIVSATPGFAEVDAGPCQKEYAAMAAASTVANAMALGVCLGAAGKQAPAATPQQPALRFKFDPPPGIIETYKPPNVWDDKGII